MKGNRINSWSLVRGVTEWNMWLTGKDLQHPATRRVSPHSC